MLEEAIRQVFSHRGNLIVVLSDILGFDFGEKIAEFHNGKSREDVALIIESIVVSGDMRVKIMFIDGDEIEVYQADDSYPINK